MTARSKRTVLIASGLTALAIAGWAGWSLRGLVEEQILLRRFASGTPKEQEGSARRLAEMGSIRAIPLFLARIDPQEDPRESPWLDLVEKCLQGAPRKAAPALEEFLATCEERPALAMEVAGILVGIDPRHPAAIATLVGFLRKGRGDRGRQAFEALETCGMDTVPILVECLSPRMPSAARVQAAERLAIIGPTAAAAVPPLRKLLKDPDVELRLQAADALAEIGGWEEALPVLIEGLRRGDVLSSGTKASDLAAGCIDRLGPRARGALPGLLEALEWAPSGEVTRAIAALGPEAAGPVAALLVEKPRPVHAAALAVLLEMGPQARSALPAVRKALGDDDPAVSFAAARALCRMAEPPDHASAVQVLLRELESKDRRGAAFQELTRLGPPAAPAVPKLIEAISAPGSIVRYSELRLLGAIGEGAREAVPALARRLAESNEAVEAASALLRIGPAAAPAEPALQSLLRDPARPEAAVEAAAALIAIDPGRKGVLLSRLIDALRSAKGTVRRQASRALLELDREVPEASPLLLDMVLRDDGHEGSSLHVKTLAAVGAAPETVRRLSEGLESPDASSRAQSAWILGRLGPKAREAQSALTAALRDRDFEVRAGAARALGKVCGKDRSALPDLRGLLRDRRREVRDAAREAILAIEAASAPPSAPPATAAGAKPATP